VWTKAIAAGAFLVPFLALATNFAELTRQQEWSSLGLSLVFLILTTVLLVKDLDQARRFAYVLLRPQWRSWLVRGGYALAIYGALLTFLAVSLIFEWPRLKPLASGVSAIFAVITAVYTAFLFAQAKGRDFWQSPALPLHMLVHAFMAGAAVFGLLSLAIAGGERWNEYLRLVFCASIVLNLIVLVSELITPHPTADAKATVQMILSGRFRFQFWIGTLLLGNVLPLILAWLGGPLFLALTGVFVLIGIYITEHLWVRAPQLIPLS
jgi:formate-dependent nitrite reductase membrane component NrfD